MEKINFYYDPKVSKLDTNLWKVISGSAPAYVDGGLIVNNTEIISYNQLKKATLITRVRIPTVPQTGDDRFIGFAQLSVGVYLGFKIIDDELLCYSKNEDGEESSVAIDWRSVWTDTEISLKVISTGFDATFYINNEKVAYINAGSTVSYVGYKLSQYPMNVYIRNKNSDQMIFGSLNALDVYSYIIFDAPTNSNTDLNVYESEALTISEGNTDTKTSLASVNSPLSITESVSSVMGNETININDAGTVSEDVSMLIDDESSGLLTESSSVTEEVTVTIEV